MKNEIRKILNNSKALKENKELKEIFKDTFDNFADEISGVMKKLEKNVLSDFYQNSNKTIFTTILTPDQLDAFSDEFSPAIVFQTPNYDLDSLSEKFQKERNFILKTIFVNKSYSEIQQVIEEDKKYTGTLFSSDGTEFEFTYYLEFNDSFKKKESELFSIYEKNNLKWTTIYSPFVRKCFNVRINNIPENMQNIDGIKNIELNLDDSFQDKIPVWNIVKEEVPYQRTIRPYKDTTYFVYAFAKNDFDLISPVEQEIESVIDADDEVEIVIKEEDFNWNIYKITKIEEIEKLEIESKLFSNKVKDTFIVSDYHPKTEAAIRQEIMKYDFIKDSELLSIDRGFAKHHTKYENQFKYNVKNIFFEIRQRPDIHIEFDDDFQKGIFRDDAINFIFAELELIYPEIRWS